MNGGLMLRKISLFRKFMKSGSSDLLVEMVDFTKWCAGFANDHDVVTGVVSVDSY